MDLQPPVFGSAEFSNLGFGEALLKKAHGACLMRD